MGYIARHHRDNDPGMSTNGAVFHPIASGPKMSVQSNTFNLLENEQRKSNKHEAVVSRPMQDKVGT